MLYKENVKVKGWPIAAGAKEPMGLGNQCVVGRPAVMIATVK